MTNPASDECTPMNLALGESASDDILCNEAAILGRYLVGHVPNPELTARYVQAERRCGGDRLLPRDETLVRCVQRLPWLLGSLDSACALLRPQSALRAKVLRMAAILEASPDDAEKFLPAERRLLSTLCELSRAALSSILQIAVGVAAMWLLTAAKTQGARA